MLRKLNKLRTSNFFVRITDILLKKGARVFAPKLSPTSGQVAVVLILIIAIALIFYAITLNLGRIVQNKLTTTVAANKGASLLASQMASYGQSKFMTELGGKKKKCGFTTFGRILIAIGIGLLIAFTLGAATPLATIALSATQIAILVVVAATTVALDVLIIQPKIDKLWNKDIGEMTQASSFLEQGIKAALQSVVTDSKQVLDEKDMDLDRLFGLDALGEPIDVISRFAVYYNERLKGLRGLDPGTILPFLEAMDELVYDGTDGWGLYDPIEDVGGCEYLNPATPVPSQCNKCCYPINVPDPLGGAPTPIRDVCCSPPCYGMGVCPANYECGVDAFCGVQTGLTPGISPFDATYPWVYDPFFENPTNAFESFRELMGRDDEMKDYKRDLARIAQYPLEQLRPPLMNEFVIEDTTGYLNVDGTFFGGTGYGVRGVDPWGGIYPFFYKVRDWGMDLMAVGTPGAAKGAYPEHCYWYDGSDFAPCGPIVYPATEPRELLQAAYRLDLPNNPLSLEFNVTPRVDPMNTCWKLGTDKISVPVYITTEVQGQSSRGGAYVYNYNFCAQDVLYPNYDETKPMWKSGADRYCSTDWPYEATCPKHGVGCVEDDGMGGTFPRDCRCGEPGALPGDQWPDDPIDDIVYGLSDFLEIALQLLPPRGGPITLADRAAELVRTFDQWYPAIADFIEPGMYSGAVPNVDCFICKVEDGYLHQWARNLEHIAQRLQDWLDEGYWGSTCEEVWCMPDPTLGCPELHADEIAAFACMGATESRMWLQQVARDINANGAWGTNWGVSRKNFGNQCDGVACDIICNQLAGCQELYDIIFNAPCGPDWYNYLGCEDSVSPTPYWAQRPCLVQPSAPASACSAMGSPQAIVSCNWANRPSASPGGMQQITRCLDHNMSFNGGNAARFQACYDACDWAVMNPGNPRFPLGSTQDYVLVTENCGNGVGTFLPRSLLDPLFDASGEFVPPDMDNLTPYTECPDYCDSCTTICTNDYNLCTATCNASLAACLGGCPAFDPACVPTCNNEFNICMNDPPPVGCNPVYRQCADQCECNTPAGSNVGIPGLFECCDLSAPLPAPPLCPHPTLLIDLNVPAEPFKNTCWPPEFDFDMFFDKVYRSVPEAENQVAKFRQRWRFLGARIDEIMYMKRIINEAAGQLRAFLEGPAADLIQQRINFGSEQELPYQVIYGWQGDPPPLNPPPAGRGLWHIVKVEARVPGKCNNGCDTSQTQDTVWPYIRRYTRAWGLQRCYELSATDGVVKLRVTRYDENRPANPMLFPNGLPIWSFRSTTDRSWGNTAANIYVQCPPIGGLGSPYEGAFLANGPDDTGAAWGAPGLPSDTLACWTEANRLITSFGVESETCAKYYFHEGTRTGFDFRFIPCRFF